MVEVHNEKTTSECAKQESVFEIFLGVVKGSRSETMSINKCSTPVYTLRINIYGRMLYLKNKKTFWRGHLGVPDVHTEVPNCAGHDVPRRLHLANEVDPLHLPQTPKGTENLQNHPGSTGRERGRQKPRNRRGMGILSGYDDTTRGGNEMTVEVLGFLFKMAYSARVGGCTRLVRGSSVDGGNSILDLQT